MDNIIITKEKRRKEFRCTLVFWLWPSYMFANENYLPWFGFRVLVSAGKQDTFDVLTQNNQEKIKLHAVPAFDPFL